eukprot:CAMPEP_0178401884 /NCGR_PEP_ID=MMETSP0689_2-20121128/16541_1 /TAXON_ID=160604 /ORGANISM="Amphidinium massartii, Strain CS-259" /LENGTH=495 /DNA_ID=CAMNT_0020022737 /DNA_START=11 /DNA_END=1498 /DNA_ORIENTATION=-
MAPFYAWPHTDNLAATLLSEPHLEEKLDRTVCVTEKLDGSNMAVHVRRQAQPQEEAATAKPQWCLVGIQGRNQHVWSPATPVAIETQGHTAAERASRQENFPAMTYGNAKALLQLPALVAQVAVQVAESLQVDELVLFGEAFKVTGQTAKKEQSQSSQQQQRKQSPAASLASFHPFGFKVINAGSRAAENEGSPSAESGEEESAPKSSGSTTAHLTVEVHELFSKFAVAAPPVDQSSGDALQHYLLNSAVHVVCPPAIIWNGTLREGAEPLHKYLLSVSERVEGIFIRMEPNGIYCKWKAPLFEEQQNPPALEELVAARYSKETTGRTASRTALRTVIGELEEQADKGGLSMEARIAALPAELKELFGMVADLVQKSVAIKSAQRERVAAAKASKPVKEAAPFEQPIRERVRTAVQREATKHPSLNAGTVEGLNAAARKDLAQEVVDAVVAEVQEQMATDGEECTAEMLRFLSKEATQQVFPAVMKCQLTHLLAA